MSDECWPSEVEQKLGEVLRRLQHNPAFSRTQEKVLGESN